MKRLFILLAVTLLSPLPTYASSIFKCIHANTVTWQEVACATDSEDLPTRPVERSMRRGERVGDEAVTRPDNKDSTRAEFQVGILDLHVLNDRRWGKPQRIKRTREAGAWHEYWDYETGPNGGRQLHFVNGRLAGAANVDPPASVAGASMIEVYAER